MKENFNKFMESIYLKEGYYSNHGWDAGGETLFGISRVYNPDWIGWKIFDSYKVEGGVPSEEKMFPLLDPHVRDLYKNRYWDNAKCDDLPSGVDLFIADCCVNPGGHFARFTLQRIVEAYPDGIIGPKTLAKVDSYNPKRLLQRLHDERGVYYAVESNPNVRKKAIRGWVARNRSVYEKCLEMLCD